RGCRSAAMRFRTYSTDGFYDEMFSGDGLPRSIAQMLVQNIESLTDGELERRQKAADLALLNMGITFTVYGHDDGMEKVWQFHIDLRIKEAAVRDYIERGLQQRIIALNLLIDDIYPHQRIIKDGVVPGELVSSGKCFLNQCVGLDTPRGVWCHI